MNLLSASLRFLCGIGLIVAAYATYNRTKAHVAAGEPIQIAGVTFGASPGQVSLALAFVALIGVLLIIVGIVTLMKRQR
jgi:hypothetical protein